MGKRKFSLREEELNKGLVIIIVLLICSIPLIANGDVEKVTYSYGTSALFVGIMAALWATRTGRSGLSWFFFGWFLAPIACLVAWLKNNEDKRNLR